jgi:hypothetical protein
MLLTHRKLLQAKAIAVEAPYKGPSAESGEKHEPVSDIDTVSMGSLIALDQTGRLEKRTLPSTAWMSAKCQK